MRLSFTVAAVSLTLVVVVAAGCASEEPEERVSTESELRAESEACADIESECNPDAFSMLWDGCWLPESCYPIDGCPSKGECRWPTGVVCAEDDPYCY